jgi:general nucleoside transport system ATP-binding protein
MTDKKAGENQATGSPLAIQLKSISKSFGLVRANRNVDLSVEAGTIHGIIGENGAGKSTLMNILYGLHRADSGEFWVNGEQTAIRSSADAIGLGIGMVHQHFMLVPNFSVIENVMLGTEGGSLLRDGRAATLETLGNLSRDYGMGVDPEALVSELPVGLQQRVEIVKALKGGAKILILDEPTGVLTPNEAQQLFEILKVLRDDGVTVLLITHKLAEIMAITDNVSIMRAGEMVGHRNTSETNPQELAELMVGRSVLLSVDRGQANPGEVLMSVDNLDCLSSNGRKLLSEMSFNVRGGEILGVAGVAGNGQSELLEILTGMRSASSGTIEVLGQTITAADPKDPKAVRAMGVGHIPEDRHHHGLILEFEAQENIVLGQHDGALAGKGRMLDNKAITAHCRSLMDIYDVRPTNPHLSAKNFSGGNQQKLVIARELSANPKVLIVGQPTRGVDIGAIEFIHKELIALRDAGCAILLVSVELDEIMGLSDRIMVMNAGQQVGILDREDANEQKLGLMMAGLSADQAA